MSNGGEVDRYWRQCLDSVPGLNQARGYRTKCFGNTAEMARILMQLVAGGDKTGTFALVSEFRDRGEALPAVGDQVIVIDADGRPGCLYRITEVEILPFDTIGIEHVACEGPRLRDLTAWREVHWQFWSELLKDTPHEPASDMPVIFQRFECLSPPQNRE